MSTPAPPSLRQWLHPVLTPAFRTWWRINRGMTLGVRCLAHDSAGRVALVRHSYRPGWHLPGGGVESGETLLDAALKELAEETALLATAPPRLFSVYANHANFKNDHVALFVFDQFEVQPFQPNSEIEDMAFFPLDALPQELTAGSRARFAEVFEGAPISPHW